MKTVRHAARLHVLRGSTGGRIVSIDRAARIVLFDFVGPGDVGDVDLAVFGGNHSLGSEQTNAGNLLPFSALSNNTGRARGRACASGEHDAGESSKADCENAWLQRCEHPSPSISKTATAQPVDHAGTG